MQLLLHRRQHASSQFPRSLNKQFAARAPDRVTKRWTADPAKRRNEAPSSHFAVFSAAHKNPPNWHLPARRLLFDSPSLAEASAGFCSDPGTGKARDMMKIPLFGVCFFTWRHYAVIRWRSVRPSLPISFANSRARRFQTALNVPAVACRGNKRLIMVTLAAYPQYMTAVPRDGAAIHARNCDITSV